MPGWTAAVVRVIVGGVPAIIVAISGASILFIALFLPRDRRDYALKAADCAFAAAGRSSAAIDELDLSGEAKSTHGQAASERGAVNCDIPLGASWRGGC